MKDLNRPLSPHLQVYQPQITSVMSIVHRLTGVLTTLGVLLIIIWLILLMGSGVAFSLFGVFLNSWFGQLLLVGWSFGVFYHSFNGLRHLAWDMGKGFEKDQFVTTGKWVISLSVVFTIFLWGLIWAV